MPRSASVTVNGAWRIAGLELKQGVRPDTADSRVINDAFARQGASWIGDPINWIGPNAAVLVKDDHVNVNLAARPVVEDNVPLRCLI